jgi:hypothetical protein
MRENRKHPPLSFDYQSINNLANKVIIDKQLWRAASQGFQDTTWETNDFFFSGICKTKKSFIELYIPEEYQTNIRNLHLFIDLQAETDVFFDIHVFSDDGRKTRSDWRIFSGGKGLFVLDLKKMDLVPGLDNIGLWQGPWVGIRFNISVMKGRRINIRKIFFMKEAALFRQTHNSNKLQTINYCNEEII